MSADVVLVIYMGVLILLQLILIGMDIVATKKSLLKFSGYYDHELLIGVIIASIPEILMVIYLIA